MKLTEHDIRCIIKESLASIISEVRYIPSYNDFHDKFKYDFADNEPIYNNEKIRVFHGTDMKTALKFAKNGIDGTEKANRRFSYEICSSYLICDSAGNRTRKLLPFPFSPETSIRPFRHLTASSTIARPNPVPGTESLFFSFIR